MVIPYSSRRRVKNCAIGCGAAAAVAAAIIALSAVVKRKRV